MDSLGPFDRLVALRELLKEKNCTHILVSDSLDSTGICGFPASNLMLLVSKKIAHLITDFRYEQSAKAFCSKNKNWSFVKTTEGEFSCLASLLPRVGKCGIQSDSLTLDQFERLKRQCPKSSFRTLSGAIGILLIPKNAFEIRSMKTAAACADTALSCWVSKLQYGITEVEAAKLLESFCSNAGSQKPAFDTIVLFGENSALPHGRPSRRRLTKGDFVLVDFGCMINGYSSDMTRTFCAGKAHEKQKLLYEIVLKAQSAALQYIRAGVTASAVDATARGVITAMGYGENFGHGTGHGVGLRIHEKPRLSSKDSTVLPCNAVVTVEPGIYVPGFGGVRIEDLVKVTDRGKVFLSHFPKDRMEISL